MSGYVPVYKRKKLPQLAWNLDILRENTYIHSCDYSETNDIKKRNYSVKMLRYWLMYHLLLEESRLINRKLKVCEVGIDKGQMQIFVNTTVKIDLSANGVNPYSEWFGVDAKIRHEALAGLNYTGFCETDIEKDLTWFNNTYDVLILLHVLEHLWKPELFFNKLSEKMKPGSVIIGGFPSIPDFIIPAYERKRRFEPGPFSHVSGFSYRRLTKMAASAGLSLDFSAASFFSRSDGSKFEDYKFWARLNMLAGGIFKCMPSELYFLARKS